MEIGDEALEAPQRLQRPGHRVVPPGADLRVSTDHAEYAERILACLGEARGLEALDWDDANPNTHFEAKYLAQGRSIRRFRYRRGERS